VPADQLFLLKTSRLNYPAIAQWIVTEALLPGHYVATLNAAGVSDLQRNAVIDPGPLEFDVTTSAVVGRHLFYNNSAFDGRTPGAAAADDAAIATDKVAARPPESGWNNWFGTFANVSSYTRGINGVMIDVAGLPAEASLTASDFEVSGGAPLPAAISVRRGAGVGSSDRVTLVWPDGAIRNRWLGVRVKVTANTGLASPDTFYFESLVADARDPTGAVKVTALDLVRVRRVMGSAAPGVTDLYDFNRDGRINALDLFAVHRNLGAFAPPIIAPMPQTVQLGAGVAEATAWLRGM